MQERNLLKNLKNTDEINFVKRGSQKSPINSHFDRMGEIF